MLTCLKMLVIFLICGDEYVKVAHLVLLLELFRSILSLSRLAGLGGFRCCAQCVICVAIPYLVVLCWVGVRAFCWWRLSLQLNIPHKDTTALTSYGFVPLLLQCRTPYTAVHTLVLLMMDIIMPETCWDKSLIINIGLVASCWFLCLHRMLA